jgi:YfiH family protein
MNPDWLQPDWPAPARVKALCTSRRGGASGGAYDSFNLGDHVGDAPAAVAANRAALARVLGVRPVFLSQVQGTEVQALDAASLDGQAADAAVSQQTGVACTIMVADCLPVLLTDLQGRRVAAAHAGWRGLAGRNGIGILEETLKAFRAPALDGIGFLATEIIAWLGPCIGPQAFEVGAEVRQVFVDHDPAAATLFAEAGPGKWRADLAGLARQRLAALGVQQVFGNDSSPAWCTVSQPSRFFSHRRDRVSGRLAACIWLV